MLWRHGSGRLQAAPRSARRSVNGVAERGRACRALVRAPCWRLVRAAFASIFPCAVRERRARWSRRAEGLANLIFN